MKKIYHRTPDNEWDNDDDEFDENRFTSAEGDIPDNRLLSHI